MECDEKRRVGLAGVLHYKDGRVLLVVDERVVPPILVSGQQWAHLRGILVKM